MKCTLLDLAAFGVAVSIAVTPVAAKDVDPKEKDGDTKETATAPAVGSQQNKMKTCNAEASKKELKGDERRAFMSSCLKG